MKCGVTDAIYKTILLTRPWRSTIRVFAGRMKLFFKNAALQLRQNLQLDNDWNYINLIISSMCHGDVWPSLFCASSAHQGHMHDKNHTWGHFDSLSHCETKRKVCTHHWHGQKNLDSAAP